MKNMILAVSSGTTIHEDFRKVEEALKAAFPTWSFSHTVTPHLNKTTGEEVEDISTFLKKAAEISVENIIIQPTSLFCGSEYEKILKVATEFKDKFSNLIVADPLINSDKDIERVAAIMIREALVSFGYETIDKAASDNVALIFVGHGSNHSSASIYKEMGSYMKKRGLNNVFIGTIMGSQIETSSTTVIEKVKALGYTKVILSPFMITAGFHAKKDIAGDSSESWKSQLIREGLKVETLLVGLGSIKEIQDLYVTHTSEAIKKIL